jgi:hypothetical protein
VTRRAPYSTKSPNPAHMGVRIEGAQDGLLGGRESAA